MTYNRIIRHLFFLVFTIVSINSSLLAQGTAGLDCSDALRLCTTASRNDTIKFSPPHPTGLVNDLVNGDSVSWLTGEERPFWYTFVAQNTGPFEMVISDNVTIGGLPLAFDYPNNWAIFDVTSGCGNIGLATEIAGIDNKATNNSGPTGILFNPPANGRFIGPITLTAGRTYALIIDFGEDVLAGFDIYNTIDFNVTSLAGAVQFAPLSANFSVSDDTVCTGQVITFTDLTTAGTPPFIYGWDFGDGSGTSTVANPTYSYSVNGTYTVSQTVDADSNFTCTDVATQQIVVQDITVTLDPVVDLCTNDGPVTLVGTPAGGTFSGAGVVGNTFDPSITGVGSFAVTYSFTDADGCTNTDNITVNVLGIPALSVDKASENICGGIGSATFTASGADTYQWFEVGNPTVLTTSNVLNVSPAVTTQYAVRGENLAGCSDFDTVTVFILPNPTVNITPSADPICAGDNSILTASGADTYEWFEVGNAVAISTVNPLTVSPATSTDYLVIGTITASGCIDSATVTITVNPLPIVNASADVNPICPGTTSNLTGSGADTYQWFEVGNPVAIATTTATAVTPATDTDYFVVGTSTLTGCFDTAFITINVSPNPVIAITPDANPICEGENTNLTASGADTYQWFESGNAVSIGNTTAINVSPTVSTDYLVVGTVTATGCFDTAFITLNVDPAPTITATPSADPICSGESSNLTAGGADTYVWFEVGNPIAIATSTIITVSPTITADYLVIGTVTATGCFDTGFVTLDVNPLPVVNVIADVNPICPGGTSNLTGSGADTYQWFEVGNAVAIATTPSTAVSPVVNTDYFVVGTNTLNGCFDTAFITINVSLNPVIAITPDANPICEGENTNLTAAGADTYQWFESGNAVSIGNTTAINVSPIVSTDYLVVGTVTATGCFDTAFITLNVDPAPTITATPSADPICIGESTNLTAGGADSYEWFEIGNAIAISTSTIISVSPTVSTDYLVVGTVTATGCFDTAFITITVNPSPTVNAIADANPICPGGTSNLTGSGADTYQWFEVGNAVAIATTASTAVSPSADTDYFVVGTNTLTGCTDTAFITITTNALPNLSITGLTTNPICFGDSTQISFTASGALPYPNVYISSAAGQEVISITGSPQNVFFTPTTPGVVTYVIDSVEDSNGCVSLSAPNISGSAVVTVNDGIDSATFVADTAICLGESASLTAETFGGAVGSSPFTYFFTGRSDVTGVPSPFTFVDTPPATATYILDSVTDNFGCNVNVNQSVTITINPSPGTFAFATANPICLGGSTNLVAGGATNYQWFQVGNPVSLGNTSTISVSPVATTDYFAIGTDGVTGCFDTAFTTVSVVASITPTASIAFTPDTACTGDTVNFTTTVSGSGLSPTFTWFINNGVVPGANASNFSTATLNPGDEVKVEMISSELCAVSIAADSVEPVIINSAVSSVTVAQIPSPACTGDPVLFLATPTNGGASPSYSWTVNGALQSGVTTDSFNISTLTGGEIVAVQLNPSASCISGPATDNVTANITGAVTPTVSLIQNPSPGCAGDTVQFIAVVSGQGSSPVFEWRINGLLDATVTGGIYESTTFSNGDNVDVTLISSASCATGNANNNINAIISTPLSPSVSIAQNPDPVCPGDTVVFTATPVNGGGSPSFVWSINGAVQLNDTIATLERSTFNIGDIYEVILISSETCITGPDTASATINVGAPVTPTVSVIQIPDPVCNGDTAFFNTVVTGGGASPSFAWTVNGLLQSGFTGNAFFSNTLANGDIVEVTLTSSDLCATGPATGNVIANVTSNVTPTVSITQTPSTVCIGDNVTFDAIPTGQGSSPVYEWRVNGLTQSGFTGSTFNSSTIVNGDLIEVLLTPSASCATGNATGNLTANVTNIVVPSVTLVQNPGIACKNSLVDVVASQSGGGVAPTFAWTLNGAAQAITGGVFSSSTFNNGDTVDVVMTSSSGCATPATASDQIILSISDSTAPSVTISQFPSPACSGDSVQITATSFFGGSTPNYDWFVNGGLVLSGPGDFIAGNTFANGDEVIAILTSSETCALNPAADTVILSIPPSFATNIDSLVFDTNPTCGGTAISFNAFVSGQGLSPLYIWELNGLNLGVNDDSISLNSLQNGDSLLFTVASSSSCASPGIDQELVVITNIFNLQPVLTVVQPSACGINNGIIRIDTILQGSGNYEVLFNGVDSADTEFSGLGSGSFLITINDTITSCSFDTTVVISVPGAITASVNTVPVVCSGQNNGEAQFLSVSGGSGFFEFSIDTGITWQSSSLFTNLAPGNYLGIIRDSLDPSCTFQLNFFIGSSFNVSAIIQVDKETSCGANDAVINILSVTGGTAPYNFILLDSIGDTLEPLQPITSFVDSLSPGNYTLVIIDANPCEISINLSIDGLDAPTAVPVELQAVTCNGGNDGILSLTNSQGGTGAYVYSIDAGAFQGSSTFTNVSGGAHILTIQDVNTSCASNYPFVQSEPDTMQVFSIINPPMDCSSNDGSIVIDSVQGGTGPNYQFSINGSPQLNVPDSLINLSGGLYTVVVTDANSCTDTTDLIMNIPGAGTPNFSVTNVNCFGQSTGEININNISGGTAPYQFSIDNINFDTARTISGLSAGSGVLFMLDSSNCLTTTPYLINENSEITANIVTTSITDCDSTNGEITINTISGGQPNPNYVVDLVGIQTVNQATPITFRGLDNLVYLIRIIDGLNCEVQFVDTVFAPNNISIDNFSVTDPLCFGSPNGSIDISAVSGGLAPYNYFLNGNSSPSNITGLVGDSTYTVTVSDADNCDVSFDVTLNQPDSLNFDVDITTQSSCGNANGSVLVINTSGGTGSYAYELIGISGQQTSNLFDSLSAGTYTMLMSDANNCQRTESFTITGSGAFSFNVNTTSIPCPGDANGSISITNLIGGNAPFIYSIDSGNTFNPNPFSGDITVSDLDEGTYRIVIRDSLNCLYTFGSDVVIVRPEEIFADVENITMTDPDSATGRIAIYDIVGGTSPYELSVDNDSFFVVTFNAATQSYDTVLEQFTEGFHTLLVRDVNGCTNSFEAYVEAYEFADRFTIPNIFTPNNDGFNDRFVIPKLPENSKLEVFDKVGRPVFSSDNYENDWDAEGYYDGTYFYILDVPNQGVYRGYVEVFR